MQVFPDADVTSRQRHLRRLPHPYTTAKTAEVTSDYSSCHLTCKKVDPAAPSSGLSIRSSLREVQDKVAVVTTIAIVVATKLTRPVSIFWGALKLHEACDIDGNHHGCDVDRG